MKWIFTISNYPFLKLLQNHESIWYDIMITYVICYWLVWFYWLLIPYVICYRLTYYYWLLITYIICICMDVYVTLNDFNIQCSEYFCLSSLVFIFIFCLLHTKFGTKRMSIWFKINQKVVNIIWFRFDLIRFLCMYIIKLLI